MALPIPVVRWPVALGALAVLLSGCAGDYVARTKGYRQEYQSYRYPPAVQGFSGEVSSGPQIDSLLAMMDEGMLLHAAEHRVPMAERALYQTLCDELARADDCSDLPSALIHPDFVPPNIIASTNGDLVSIDWTGAGLGPRVPSLGFLLWAAGAQGMAYVDAVVAGYRSWVRLEPDELELDPE